LAVVTHDVLTGGEGFEKGWNGWTSDNYTAWQIGAPAFGPVAAHAGVNCAGVVQTGGNYPANVDSRLISPPLTIPSANQSPSLRFWHWYSIGGGDHAAVEIKVVGSSAWTTISPDYGDVGDINAVHTSGGVWTPASLDLSQHSGQTVQIAFHFVSNPGSAIAPNGGWFVDDVFVQRGNLAIAAMPDQTVNEVNTLGVPGALTFQVQVIGAGATSCLSFSLPWTSPGTSIDPETGGFDPIYWTAELPEWQRTVR
jgi:hypothetical protein